MTEDKLKDIIDYVKAELDKLKDVEDAKVKEVVGGLNEYIGKIDIVEKIEEKKEDSSEEETKETTEEESVEEAKPEEEATPAEETPAEPATEETKSEAPAEETPAEETPVTEEASAEPEGEKELSMEVAQKLEESAIELQKLEKEMGAKQEIIDGYKGKIVELEKELDSFKQDKEIELKKRYEVKANKLIELYASLGIEKKYEEIELAFNEEQIDKLIGDLEVMQTSVQKSQRRTTIKTGLELGAYNRAEKKEMTSGERAKVLFGI